MIEVTEKVDTSERKMTMEEAMNLVELAMRVNGFEERNDKRGLNCEHKYPTVFIDFLGHVVKLGIQIYSRGWRDGSAADETFNFYLDEKLNKFIYNRCTRRLQGLIELIEKDSEQKNAPTADQSNVGAQENNICGLYHRR